MVRCKARKHAVCEISGADIAPGDEVFRPVTNKRNRMFRILSSEMDRLIGFDAWYLELSEIASKNSISVADAEAWFESFVIGFSPVDALVVEYPELIATVKGL